MRPKGGGGVKMWREVDALGNIGLLLQLIRLTVKHNQKYERTTKRK